MSNLGSLFLATMDLGLSVALICVLFIVGIAVGGLFGWLIYKKSTDKKIRHGGRAHQKDGRRCRRRM